MTVIGEAYILVKPDDSRFGPETEKGVLASVGSIARKAAAIFGAIFVGREVLDFAKSAFAQAQESIKVGAQTEAVIKSTGGAANVTAGQVGQLADALSRKIGVDDEAIQSSENLLLTFTNVQNRVGAGNDIFNQATATVQDMAAALHEDASGAAIQLGKALNDPIAGVTALRRVGVQLTDQQTEQIKKFVEAGDVMSAQKVILGELTKEFGGSAAAIATPADKLKVAWENVQETIGLKLMPVLSDLFTFLADRLPGALDFLGRTLGPIFKQVGAFIYSLRTGFTEDEGTPIERVALRIRAAFQAVFGFLMDHKEIIVGVLAAIGVALAAWAVQATIAAVQTALALAPIIAIGAAIAGVVAGFIYAYKHWATFRAVVDGVVKWLKDVAWPGLQSFVKQVVAGFASLVGFVQKNWASIREAIGHAITLIKFEILLFIGPMLLIWHTFHNQILAVVKLVWGQIQNVVETFVRIVRDVILVVLALINGDWGKAWDAIKDILAAAWTEIVGTVQFFLGLLWTIFGGALTAIGDAFSSTWQAITGTASAAWQALTSGASGAVDGIVGFFRALPGRILGLAGSILNAAVSIGGTIIDGLGQGLSKVASFVGDIAGAVASAIRSALHNLVQILNDAIPDHLGWGFLSVNLPHNPIPNPFHTGGVVPAGPDVNALLRGGEAVFTPDQMALLGQVISRGGGASTAAPVAGPAVLVQVDARGSTFTDLTVDRLAQRLSLRLNETLRSRQLEMNLRTGVRR